MNDHQLPKPDVDNEEKTNVQKIGVWLIAILTFIVAIAFFWKKDKSKIYKKNLYEPYKVDKKTFSRWIELFCSDIISKNDYAKLRKLSMPIVAQIRNRLGENSEETPVLSKNEIVSIADGSYATLRQSIEKFPEQFGITPSVFKSLNCFPPKIAAQILFCYKNGTAK